VDELEQVRVRPTVGERRREVARVQTAQVPQSDQALDERLTGLGVDDDTELLGPIEPDLLDEGPRPVRALPAARSWV